MTSKYPYQNLSLKDMESEQWLDVEGYEGTYQISNFGRVKSMARQIQFYRAQCLVSISIDEKILK